jgi:DNA repair exonuclease SbcCD ATPase subunit
MIVPISLKVNNFLSFKEIDYQFQNGKTILIQGRNLSDKGQKSNGSGKSVFQQAIDFAVTGSCSRKVRDIKLIHYGQEKAEITFILFNTQDQQYLRIDRSIRSKGSATIVVYKGLTSEIDPKNLVERSSVGEYNKYISSYLGISGEDFSNYFVPNENKYVSFFDSADSKKKELISRFSNISLIDGVFGKVASDIGVEDGKRIQLEKDLLGYQKEVEIYQGQINEEKTKDFSTEVEEKLSSIRDSIYEEQADRLSLWRAIRKIKKGDEENQTKLASKLYEISEDEKDLEQLYKESVEGKISAIQIEIQKLETESKEPSDKLKNLIDSKDALEKVLRPLHLTLAGTIECPKCSHKFIPNLQEGESLEHIEKLSQAIALKIEKLSASEASLNTLVKSYASQIETKETSLKTQKQKEFQLSSSIKTIKGDLTLLEKEVKDLRTVLLTSSEKISTLQSGIAIDTTNMNHLFDQLDPIAIQKELKKESKKRIDELKEKKVKSEELIPSTETKLNKVNEELSRLKTWETNFQLFQSFLANKKLKIIEGLINSFLEKMDSEIQIKLEGFKKLASGELREKITPYIYRNSNLCEYGEFSKGERVRIDFATLLALQTLINSSSPNGGLDLIFCDEIGEGIDEDGLVEVLNAFNKTGRTAFITSHTSIENLYEYMIMIEKVKGVSKIL